MRTCFQSVVILFVSVAVVFGQDAPVAIDSAEKKAVIDALCENLEREYIFPDITEEYVRMLRDNLSSGRYADIDQPRDFARTVTDEMMAIHRDRHLTVWFNPDWVKNEREKQELDDEAIMLQAWRDRTANYGFEEIKILPGNIGYLKFSEFSYEPEAYEPAIGAMSFLAGADAVVVDLRTNGGGSPEMVQFLCSYFVDNPRKHLNSFSYLDKERLTQYWTYTYLPGKRLNEIDVYILTSKRTFSAAEEFAYNLKNMKRALIIGETTGGGAHDNKWVILTDRFMMSLPFARAVNPITKANWEEVGVQPDVEVAQEKALDTALAIASKKLAETASDPRFTSYYEWYREMYEAALNPVTLDAETMRSYTGTYGPRTITLEGESLFYQREGRPKLKLVPISDSDFSPEGINRFRLRFIKDGDRVVAVEGYDLSGETDRHPKSD